MSIILKALKKIQNQDIEQTPGPALAGEPGLARPAAPFPGKSPAPKRRVAAETATTGLRFGGAPRIMLGLIFVLGVFTTGWFVSRIYSHFKVNAHTLSVTKDVNEPTGNAEEATEAESLHQNSTPPVVGKGSPSSTEEIAPATASATVAAATVAPQPVVAPSVAPAWKPVAEERPTSFSEEEAAVPGNRIRQKEAQPAKGGRPELKINAIAWKSREPRAIVNMQRVYVGDEIEGAKVLAIQRGSVLFEYGGEPFEVRF